MNYRHYYSMQRILALTTLLYSVAYVIAAIYNCGHTTTVGAVGTVVLGICGLIVLVQRDPDVLFTAGVIGVGFGAHMIFSFVEYLGGTNLLVFIISMVGVLAGILCIMFSIPLSCGNRYDTKRILIVQGVYLASYILPMAIAVVFRGENFYRLLADYIFYILFFVPVVLYIVMLYRTNFGYKGVNSRYNTNIRMLTDAMYSDQNTYAWRSDVKKLEESNYEMKPINKGHLLEESKLPLIVGGKKAYLVVHKWDDGKYYGTIMRYDDGTLIQSLRFEICDIIGDGEEGAYESFTIYGREGFFIKILIKDEEVKVNMTRLRKILTVLVGANSNN